MLVDISIPVDIYTPKNKCLYQIQKKIRKL